MEVQALKLRCQAAIENNDNLIMVLPRVSQGERIRLTSKGGPLGEIRCVNNKGETVASFDPKAVLNWIEKQELLTGKNE